MYLIKQVLIGLLIFFSSIHISYALDSIAVEKKIKYASIIFSGKVIFEKKVFLPHLKDTTFFPEEIIADPELMDFYKIRMVRVELVQKYKGKNKYFKDTLDVYIEDVPLTTNCNLIFQPGKEYLFYVLRRNYVMYIKNITLLVFVKWNRIWILRKLII